MTGKINLDTILSKKLIIKFIGHAFLFDIYRDKEMADSESWEVREFNYFEPMQCYGCFTQTNDHNYICFFRQGNLKKLCDCNKCLPSSMTSFKGPVGVDCCCCKKINESGPGHSLIWSMTDEGAFIWLTCSPKCSADLFTVLNDWKQKTLGPSHEIVQDYPIKILL